MKTLQKDSVRLRPTVEKFSNPELARDLIVKGRTSAVNDRIFPDCPARAVRQGD
jgi:hypothetical protein